MDTVSLAGHIDHNDEVEDSTMYKDSELGAMEEHKSVILHLLSQLKLGMDLTKVSIITVIIIIIIIPLTRALYVILC